MSHINWNHIIKDISVHYEDILPVRNICHYEEYVKKNLQNFDLSENLYCRILGMIYDVDISWSNYHEDEIIKLNLLNKMEKDNKEDI